MSVVGTSDSWTCNIDSSKNQSNSKAFCNFIKKNKLKYYFIDIKKY